MRKRGGASENMMVMCVARLQARLQMRQLKAHATSTTWAAACLSSVLAQSEQQAQRFRTEQEECWKGAKHESKLLTSRTGRSGR